MSILGFKIIANQRARLIGKFQAIEKNILAEQAQLLILRAKIAAFDEVLIAQNVDINPDLFAPPVAPTPRLHYFSHGELAGTCLNLLRTQRRPLTSVQMFNAIVQVKKPIWRNPADPQKIKASIKNQMKSFMRRGIVLRAGSAGSGLNAPGIWALPEYADVPWEANATVLAE